MPNQRSRGRQYPPQSPKNPMAATLLRNKLAPDVPGLDPFSESTNTPESAKGTVPTTPGVLSPIGMPIDNNRVPGRSGPAGPM